MFKPNFLCQVLKGHTMRQVTLAKFVISSNNVFHLVTVFWLQTVSHCKVLAYYDRNRNIVI